MNITFSVGTVQGEKGEPGFVITADGSIVSGPMGPKGVKVVTFECLECVYLVFS